MKTTELIKFLETNDVTKDQGYNLLIADLWNIGIVTKPPFEDQPGESHIVTEADMARPEVQAVIAFFMYQIQSVLFPVICDLRKINAQVEIAGEVFKEELDARDLEVNSILKTDADAYLNNRIDGIWRQIHYDQNELAMNSERVRVGLQTQIDELKRMAGRVGQ